MSCPDSTSPRPCPSPPSRRRTHAAGRLEHVHDPGGGWGCDGASPAGSASLGRGTDDVGASTSPSPRNRPLSPSVAPASALDAHYQDRIVVVGSTPDTVGLIHLAAVRSDDVLLVAASPDEPLRRAADSLGVARHAAFDASGLDGVATVLVANGGSGVAAAIVAAARARSIPVYAVDQPRSSDFTILDFLERRSCTLAPLAAPGRR